jgi:two-component system sensor histidine kinase AlgZ
MSKSRQHDALLFSALFNERGVLALLVVTQVVAIILALAPNVAGVAWYRLGVISLFLHITTLSSTSFLYACRRYLQKRGQLTQLSGFIFVFVITAGLFSVLFSHFAFGIEQRDELLFFVFSNMFSVLLLATLFVQFLIIHTEKEKQTKALSRAELDALQARIRPHFLYNSLNTAAELTHINACAAEQALLSLAALSQAAMRSGKAVTLDDELVLSQQFVSLEKWRFGERLTLDWRIPNMLPRIMIPCLTLQPLIENAVCHGVEPSQSPVVIKVEIHDSKNYLTIIVTNPVIKQTDSSKKHNGMALGNISQRLALFYHDKAQLSITAKNSVFRVKVVLPKQVESE